MSQMRQTPAGFLRRPCTIASGIPTLCLAVSDFHSKKQVSSIPEPWVVPQVVRHNPRFLRTHAPLLPPLCAHEAHIRDGRRSTYSLRIAAANPTTTAPKQGPSKPCTCRVPCRTGSKGSPCMARAAPIYITPSPLRVTPPNRNSQTANDNPILNNNPASQKTNVLYVAVTQQQYLPDQ